MKRLILVRHGKSSWKEDLDDHDRPLKERAYKDARLVLQSLRVHLQEPPIMWSSSANRALTTARLFQEALQVPEDDFSVMRELYTFSGSQLRKVISGCDDRINTLMVFGHNPAMTDTVNKLGDHYFDNIPTTGLCLLQLEITSWSELKKGKVLLYLFPKNLR